MNAAVRRHGHGHSDSVSSLESMSTVSSSAAGPSTPRRPLPQPPAGPLSSSWDTLDGFSSTHQLPISPSLSSSARPLPPVPADTSKHSTSLTIVTPQGSAAQEDTAANTDKSPTDWVSSASSNSSADARSIQRRTVKREFPVGSPSAGRRQYARPTGDTTPRRRKDQSGNGSSVPGYFSPGTTPTKSSTNRRSAYGQAIGSSTTKRRLRSNNGHGSSFGSFISAFEMALRPCFFVIKNIAQLLGIALSPITSAIYTFVLAVLALTTAYFLLKGPIMSFLSTLIPSSVLSLAYPLLALPRAGLRLAVPSAISSAYCDTIGIGCAVEPLPIGRLARTVSDQAIQAHDIFQSVVALGNPANMALHHTEVWELAVAVKATSGLENRVAMGDNLKELGDLTRDVKDAMQSLNAQGINSFSWILHEFERIERTIDLLTVKGSRYTTADVARQLDNLFEHLSGDLSSLLRDIENTIPIAARASRLGGTVLEELGTEHARLNKAKEETPLWRRLRDINSFSSRQLARDLQLTGDSVVNLKDTRRSLEEARGFLMGYRDQVSYFKAGVVGFHIADHGLDPEDEVYTLKTVMSQFQKSVDLAKAGGLPKGETTARSYEDVD